jgi:D-xylose 1-dehydrogenase
MSDNDAIYPSLGDRPVLISGGASGIGAALVEHFTRQGARVAFLDLDHEAGCALAERLALDYGRAPAFRVCDLREVDSIPRVVAELSAELGSFRILVNNAGRDDRLSFSDVTPALFDEGLAVNLRHYFFLAQALAPEMAAAGGGSIVNLGSICWLLANGGYPVYATSKAAISGLTRALARDLGGAGVRVNTVLPGWIMTERQVRLWLTPAAEAELLQQQCLPAKLQPDDVARMVLWLAAEDSRHVTAQSFVVDGGRA